MQRLRCIALVLAPMLAQPAARAGEFNDRLLTTGERASGMGGAYVALADDNSGMLFNPAGIVHADRGAPTATANVISGSRTRYERVFGARSWDREALAVVPSFFGVTRKDGHLSFGASVAVTEHYAEDQTDEFRNVRVGNTVYDALRVHNDAAGSAYNLGLSIAARAGDSGWSSGATLYLHYAERDRSFTQRLSQDAEPASVQDDTSLLVQTQLDDETLGLNPVLGVQYRNAWGSWGLSVSRLFVLHRDYHYVFTGNVVTPGDALSFDLIDASDEHERQPLRVSAGMARFFSSGNTLSVQVDYVQARKVDADDAPAGLPPRDLDTRRVVNVAVGMETRLSPRWWLRSGVYTDFANNDAGEARAFERREEIDVYGLALALSRRDGRGYWTVGGDLAYGEGEATLGDVGFGQAAVFERVDASHLRYSLLISTTW